MRKQLANILTISRIVVSTILIYCPIFGAPFWILYAWCGLSDVLDGYVARKTDSASERGAMLDSVADLVFLGVWLEKIIPVITLPSWLWACVILVSLIKIVLFFVGRIRHHQWLDSHTISNKATGILLFLLPVVIQFVPATIPALVVCAVMMWSLVEDGMLLFKARKE